MPAKTIDKQPRSSKPQSERLITDVDIEELIARTRLEGERLAGDVIEAIAAFDTFDRVSLDDAVDIIGVVAGVKPTALLYNFDSEVDLTTLELLVAGMGLRYEYADEYLVISRHQQLIDIETSMLLNSYSRTGEDIDAYEDQERLTGRLLGYPTTAIDFFLERTRVVRETGVWPPLVEIEGYAEESGLDTFVQFMLSPDHSREELAYYLEPLQQAVKVLTPRLYKHITETAF